MGRVELGVLRRELQVRGGDLSLIEQDKLAETVRDQILLHGALVVRGGIHDIDHLDPALVFVLDAGQVLRKTQAMGAGGFHHVQDDHLAAILVEVVLLKAQIRKREARGTAVGEASVGPSRDGE